jgi:hypothetical protein
MRELLRLENDGGSLSRRNEQVVRSDVGEGGGGSHSPASPYFLVHNKDNVNAGLWRAMLAKDAGVEREPPGNRTLNLLIKSQLLYQLS